MYSAMGEYEAIALRAMESHTRVDVTMVNGAVWHIARHAPTVWHVSRDGADNEQTCADVGAVWTFIKRHDGASIKSITSYPELG